MTSRAFQSLSFDNRFIQRLPGDLEGRNFPRAVTGALWSTVQPRVATSPSLVAFSGDLADELGFALNAQDMPQFTEVMAGNQLLPGMQPYAMVYGGHQFGNWAGQLGDGRAINLGEAVTPSGQHFTLQLKGAGPTPYSRTADGLAVLRSSLREFLCSEAMHYLGVPTTRALSLVTTGDPVRRDMFYDGRPGWEPGAVVCRVAPSFTRFGHFELPASRGDLPLLRQLLDVTLATDFPHLGAPSKAAYVAFFHEVCQRTATMIAHWMRVGFVHGVMNTDNMSILGLTIDYGPYGWLEGFDLDWTPNTTDAQGRRYRYGNQPTIALWNLAQLGNALYPLVEAVEPLNAGLDVYRQTLEQARQRNTAAKLGLQQWQPEDDALVEALHRLLQLAETDMTIFYRRLADVDLQLQSVYAETIDATPLMDALYDQPDAKTASPSGGQHGVGNDASVTGSSVYPEHLQQWLQQYRLRVQQDVKQDPDALARRYALMQATNPKYVLRNYLAQQAIDLAGEGDFSLVQRLLEVLKRPYDEQPEHEALFAKRPEWARNRAGCSMLSCSS